MEENFQNNGQNFGQNGQGGNVFQDLQNQGSTQFMKNSGSIQDENFSENNQENLQNNEAENGFSESVQDENLGNELKSFKKEEQDPEIIAPPAQKNIEEGQVVDDNIKYPSNFDELDLKGKFLSIMVENEASDIYPVPGYFLGVKIEGGIFPAKRLGKLTKEIVKEFLFSIFTEKNKKEFEEELETDFAYEWEREDGEHFRFRVNAFHQAKNPSATFRYLRSDIKSLESLGVPAILKDLSERNSGIVLLCGVTGSGKSTTIAAMIDNINENFSKHIISIEDPVEYTFEKKKSWIEQREVGTDTISFQKAMKSALRQNPNVLFLGEMRDLESIKSAITIAESGHLVFSTIHARNSMQCINKIIDSFSAAQQNQVRLQLSEALAGIITQKLIPKIGGGLQVVMEIMVNNYAVGNLIRENQVHQLESIIQTGKQEGMQLLDEDILKNVQLGNISPENAIKHSNDPDGMRNVLGMNESYLGN
ncbi:PilT/PilU family type 4a pilus ATPase [Candidatus Gracilibacteria bacterium]|nr:PilT/PilU family type 4a pilus ATPase [Candidatus Gracilibacteria bacterium]